MELEEDVADRSCHKCDSDKMTCEGRTTLETIEIHRGYFRFTEQSSEVYQCPLPEACIGHTGGGLNISAAGADMCEKGYTSALCSQW